ncbi:MAG TPA: hypothetical protein VKE94_09355 [Gemmataceae bacterium]|nr:hypothetical protein [Gemmataceae bacterium]
MTCVLVLSAAVLIATEPQKDEAKKGPPVIEGTWIPNGGTNGKSSRTGEATGEKLVIKDGEAEWTHIPYVSEDKPGNCKVKLDESKKPHTIELTVGDTKYKGIYQFTQFKGAEGNDNLAILLSEPGADFPKEFSSPRPLRLPKEFKGTLLFLVRKK